MKAISYCLLAAALMLTSACSSTSSTADNAGTSADASASTTGGGMNTDANSSAGNAAGTGTSGQSATATGDNQTVTSTASAGGAGGTGDATDLTAFASTFATMDDPTFMLTAASSNMLEVQMGQLAAQQSANADVKKFGQMMVQHHTKATQDWKAVAAPLGISTPTTLMPVHQAMMDKVMNKSGKNFDEAYMDAMETAHKLDVALFEVKSKGAQTPAVQSFATKTLPMLRSHEKMASDLESKVD